jgi:hypothetical protein
MTRLLASCLAAIAGLLATSPMAVAQGALSFFADDKDARVLIDWLNADPDLAVIVADGPRAPKLTPEMLLRLLPEKPPSDFKNKMPADWKKKGVVIFGRPDTGHRQRWRAVRGVESLQDGGHSLWYVPAGPLPLIRANPSERSAPIPDPWAGWTEESPGADPDTPYFGPSHPAAIRLTLWTRHRPYTRAELSTLDEVNGYWTGRHDLLVASDFQWGGGSAETGQWWARLQGFLNKAAVRLASNEDPKEVFWAFPSALRKLKAGMRYEARGWGLDRAIRSAALPRGP